MILLESIVRTAVRPALARLPNKMATSAAIVLLLSIGLQESRFMFRYQKLIGRPYMKGPARGFWQFELGAVSAIMNHGMTAEYARLSCSEHGIEWSPVVVHANLESNDILAATFARLLLFANPRPLPPVLCTHEEAWSYYIETWRPGKPHRETWDNFHIQSVGQIVQPTKVSV